MNLDGKVVSRRGASLTFGAQTLEDSNVLKRRKREVGPRTQEGSEVRTEIQRESEETNFNKKKEVAGDVFSLSIDSPCGRSSLKLQMHNECW